MEDKPSPIPAYNTHPERGLCKMIFRFCFTVTMLFPGIEVSSTKPSSPLSPPSSSLSLPQATNDIAIEKNKPTTYFSQTAHILKINLHTYSSYFFMLTFDNFNQPESNISPLAAISSPMRSLLLRSTKPTAQT